MTFYGIKLIKTVDAKPSRRSPSHTCRCSILGNNTKLQYKPQVIFALNTADFLKPVTAK